MSAVDVFRRVSSGLLDVLLPASCLLCKTRVDTARIPVPLCDGHREALPELRGPRCDRCSRPLAGPERLARRPTGPPFPGATPGGRPVNRARRAPLCGSCRQRDTPLTRTVAAYTYREVLRPVIRDWKFGGHELWGSWLGRRMAIVAKPRLAGGGWDALTFVPMSPRRRRERGFNPARQLARAAGKFLGLPVVRRLRKHRETAPQSRLPRPRRLENLRGVFQHRTDPGEAPVENLLLVDDIYTTGSTLETAAEVLLDAGVDRVGALVLARAVPRRPGTGP